MNKARAIIIVSLIAAALASIAGGQTKIYVGEYKFNDPRLFVMEPGGANLEELEIIPREDWLVVGLHVDADAAHVYWTHGSFGNGRIRRANLDGTGMVTLLSDLTNPRGLAVDTAGGKLYWSDTQDNRMYRANLDGSALETVIDTGDQLGRPTLDVDGGKIYFGNFEVGDIRRANLDGSEQEVLFDGLFTPVAIALDLAAGKIYWADSNTSFVSNHIARANLDGSALEILYEGLPTSSGFTGMALDVAAGALFWSDEITDAEKGVWQAALDGAGATRIYESRRGWNAGALTVVVATTECPTDIDDSGATDFTDLLTLLAAWGPCPGCPADFDGGGMVDFSDLLTLLAAWGPCESR